jgi:hypothetical protein
MLRREQAVFIYPELMKRFKLKNIQVANFAIIAVLEAFKTEEDKVTQDVNIKQMFKAI